MGAADWPFKGLTRRHYKCLCVDPPWHFKGYKKDGGSRAASRHYDVKGLRAIINEFPVQDLCHPEGSFLFLWTTGPHLHQALKLMDAWGFAYSAMGFVWVKLKRSLSVNDNWMAGFTLLDFHVGLGYTTRHNAEFVLLGRRGSVRRNARDIREIIISPVREHSRKPDEAYERIVRFCDGPRADLFSRERRRGFTCWGNQVDKFSGNPKKRKDTPWKTKKRSGALKSTNRLPTDGALRRLRSPRRFVQKAKTNATFQGRSRDSLGSTIPSRRSATSSTGSKSTIRSTVIRGRKRTKIG